MSDRGDRHDHDHQPSEAELYLADRREIRLGDRVSVSGWILDLGGGGEGVIGQLYGDRVVAIDRRKEELEEAAGGPLKVIADAGRLPFLDDTFAAATAFFFWFYVPTAEQPALFAEAARVLRPGGRLHIWDADIPPREERTQRIYAVPLVVHLPDRTIETGYGTRWKGRTQTVDSLVRAGEGAGFVIEERHADGGLITLTASLGG